MSEAYTISNKLLKKEVVYMKVLCMLPKTMQIQIVSGLN